MCNKVIGAIRIVLGIAMLYFGVTKIGASPEMMAFVGGAAHKFGLTFLSTTIWFWIAVVGEILAGGLLLTGHWAKVGALLSLIIMAFAVNAVGANLNAILVTLGSLLIVWYGCGTRCMCPCPDCKACDTMGGHHHKK